MSSLEPAVQSAVRKLRSNTKLPVASVMRTLTHEQTNLLTRRLAEGAECVFDDSFLLADAEKTILGSSAAGRGARANANANDDSGLDLFAPQNGRALSTEQERRIFLRLNYCRYRVFMILKSLADKRLTAATTRRLLTWEARVYWTRGEIVRLNMALVLAMAKRTRITGVDHAELISEGNMALLRSVDKFDCNRGFKFSTYACRAILKSFSRVATRTSRYRGYFPTEFDPELEKSDYIDQKRRDVETDCADELKSILGKNLAKLNQVEETVIRARFALEHDQPILFSSGTRKGKTLEQVGEMIGVTKERVRQIQNKALGKLRVVLEYGILAG